MENLSVSSKCYQNAGNPEVLRLVPEVVGRVLDLGCGAGDNARALFGKAQFVDGVTLSTEEATAAKQYCRRILIHNLEEGLPQGLEGTYDLVVASHVIEHICFPARLLHDVADRLSPQGKLIVALPNLLNWRHRWAMLRGEFEYVNGGIMDNTHFRWYTFQSAQRLLEKHGFEVVHSHAQGHFPLSLARRVLPKAWVDYVDRIASAAFPGMFGVQMIYVARTRH